MIPSLSRARLVAALFALLVLAGCAGPFDDIRRGTVTAETIALMDKGDMERAAPILVRVFKEDNTLEVWKQDRSGHFRLLKTYPICRFSGKLGPKVAEGDHQAPEGFYDITPAQMNPRSREYLAFNVGYPNAYDRSWGRTGDSLMVHGGCRSVGCYAMTNEGIDEIYGLAYEAFAGGQRAIGFEAFPFRLTAANLDKHRTDPNTPFWSMLKPGSDLFEGTGRPPEVAVCDGRYVFAPEGRDPRTGPNCSPPAS